MGNVIKRAYYNGANNPTMVSFEDDGTNVTHTVMHEDDGRIVIDILSHVDNLTVIMNGDPIYSASTNKEA